MSSFAVKWHRRVLEIQWEVLIQKDIINNNNIYKGGGFSGKWAVDTFRNKMEEGISIVNIFTGNIFNPLKGTFTIHQLSDIVEFINHMRGVGEIVASERLDFYILFLSSFSTLPLIYPPDGCRNYALRLQRTCEKRSIFCSVR